MKYLKIVLAFVFISVLFYLAFFSPKKFSLEGHWKTEKIVLNQETLYPKGIIDSLFKNINYQEISISDWNDSLYFQNLNLSAKFEIHEHENNQKTITLFSKEKVLDGIYQIELDTIFEDERNYKVFIELKSERNFIKFSKDVYIEPWKPEIPRRGVP